MWFNPGNNKSILNITSYMLKQIVTPRRVVLLWLYSHISNSFNTISTRIQASYHVLVNSVLCVSLFLRMRCNRVNHIPYLEYSLFSNNPFISKLHVSHKRKSSETDFHHYTISIYHAHYLKHQINYSLHTLTLNLKR